MYIDYTTAQWERAGFFISHDQSSLFGDKNVPGGVFFRGGVTVDDDDQRSRFDPIIVREYWPSNCFGSPFVSALSPSLSARQHCFFFFFYFPL